MCPTCSLQERLPVTKLKALVVPVHTHTHTRLMALCPGLPRWAGTRKVKPIWILLEQKTVSGSGVSCAICKPSPLSRQITTPAPHYSSFLQAGCPSCRPTNSVKALKAVVVDCSGTSSLQLFHIVYGMLTSSSLQQSGANAVNNEWLSGKFCDRLLNLPV